MVNYRVKKVQPKKSLEESIPLEQMEELFREHCGNITAISRSIGCTPPRIYDYMENYPHLRDVRENSRERYFDKKLDTAYDKLDEMMNASGEDAASAFKAANLILTKDKNSHYYSEKSMQNSDSCPALIMKQQLEIKEAKEELAALKAKLNG